MKYLFIYRNLKYNLRILRNSFTSINWLNWSSFFNLWSIIVSDFKILKNTNIALYAYDSELIVKKKKTIMSRITFKPIIFVAHIPSYHNSYF